ncbi:MAG: extracellular solute-binding protein [Chloroflexi bacterium]|nr:extracellular solute-binding protein [Chloroflexota bacterium]
MVGHTRRMSLVLLSAAAVMASSVPAVAQSPEASMAPAMSMDELVAAAKAEGTLNVIALPRTWCNYGAAIDGFKAKYGLAVNEISPDAGSGDELQAIIANKDNTGPAAPDVVDVGLAFGPKAVEQGLLQPYKVSTWDDIPDTVKDADGYWYGDYFGVLSFETNTAVVPNPPKDWADLLKPEYKGQVALAGDPNVANQAIQTVFASALANGGSLDDVAPGLAFWKQVVDAGNFVPVIAKDGTIDQGATPITIRWNYNALTHRDAAAVESGTVIDVAIPASGPFGGIYVQGISAYAPHPNAAKLWQEYLYSDEGQNAWLSGYCYPIRFDAMKAAGTLNADALAKLPDATGAIFPSLAQLDAAAAAIADPATGWNTVVGAVPVAASEAP